MILKHEKNQASITFVMVRVIVITPLDLYWWAYLSGQLQDLKNNCQELETNVEMIMHPMGQLIKDSILNFILW
jgi:nitrogen fixation-related uncharacterized protein